MVEQVTGGKALPPEVLAQIVAKSDGIPLFVEELAKTVLESGLFVDKGDHYALQGPLAPLAIPATLQDSLMARLDRLAPVKETAQIGAALGREFSYALISLVSPLRDTELMHALGQLVRSELIHVRGVPPDATYSFKHALVQDAAYETLLRARRQQLHLKIAKIFEDHFPKVAEAEPELVAHHYTAAGLAAPAIAYWAKAGRQAMGQSAFVEAIAHVRKGLALVSALPVSADPAAQELMLLNLLAPSLQYTQGYAAAEVREVYERARGLCESLRESAHIFPALNGLACYRFVRGEAATSLRMAEEMLQFAKTTCEPGAIMQAQSVIACVAAWAGQFEKTVLHWDQFGGSSEPSRRRQWAADYGWDAQVSIYVSVAQAKAALGYPDQARTLRDQALKDAQQLEHPGSLAFAKSLSLTSIYHLRDVEGLRQAVADTLAYCSEQSMMYWFIVTRLYEGRLLLQDGRIDAAVVAAKESISVYRSTGACLKMPMNAILAEALWKAGKTSEALNLIDLAEEEAKRDGEAHCESERCRLKGDILLDNKNDLDGAQRAYLQAIAIAQSQNAKLFELRAATSLTKLWHRNGRRDDAWNLLSPLYSWFTEGFDAADLRDARSALAALERRVVHH